MRWIVVNSLLCLFYSLSIADEAPRIARIESYPQLQNLINKANNVLVYFHGDKAVIGNIFIEAADELNGKAYIAFVYCEDNKGKEICKEADVFPDPFILRQYKDSIFQSDYEGNITVKDIVAFLTGSTPTTTIATKDTVQEIKSEKDFINGLNEKKQMMLLFYNNKKQHKDMDRLRKLWSKLSQDSDKNKIMYAFVDVSTGDNQKMADVYQMKDFPNIQYFDAGIHLYEYEYEMEEKEILKWLKDPQPKPTPDTIDAKDPTEYWQNQPNSLLNHLTDETFDDFLKKNDKVLVVFHAPWCGHCKNLKPVMENVARKAKAKKHKIQLAAIDGSLYDDIKQKHGINGYPQLKYFEKGNFKYDVKDRLEQKLMEWIRKPVAPAPPEKPWSSEKSFVKHLTHSTWDQIEDVQHSLVLFYAPWCGHCKSVKKAWTDTAAVLQKQANKLIGAIDCTKNADICRKYKVGAYPSFRYFYYGDNEEQYKGGRSQSDFIAFLQEKESSIQKDEL